MEVVDISDTIAATNLFIYLQLMVHGDNGVLGECAQNHVPKELGKEKEHAVTQPQLMVDEDALATIRMQCYATTFHVHVCNIYILHENCSYTTYRRTLYPI